MEDPFADLIPGAHKAPARIYGGPKPIDPAEQERLTLSQREDARQQQMQPLDIAAKQASIANALKTGDGSSIEEKKAAAFLTRALGANSSYEATGIGPRSYVGQKFVDSAPDILNSLPSSVGNSPDRQVADAAQDEFIAASLRQDSGAAIPPAELEKQRRIYFPMPGDGPEVLAQKRAARLRAIIGLKASAGRSVTPEQAELVKSIGPDLDKAMHGEQTPAAKPQVRMNDGTVLERQPDGAMLKIYAAPSPSGAIDNMIGPRAGEYVPADLTLGPDGKYTRADGKPVTRADVEARFKYSDPNSDEYQAAFERQFGDKPEMIVRVVGGHDPNAEEIKQDRSGVLGTIDAPVRGAADVLSFGLADELAAGADTVFGSGTMRDNLRRERAIDTSDEQNHALGRFGGQLGGALMLPTGGARTPLQLGALGAGYGAAYGFGSGDQNGEGVGDRLKRGALGLVTGGVLGYGGGTLADRIAGRAGGGPRLPPGGGPAQDIARAGQEEGVALSRPIADPSVRTRMAYLESSPGSGEPVRAALQGTSNDIEGRAAALGAGGTAQEGGALGQRIQDAGQRFVDRSRNVRNRLYDRAANLAGNAQVQPTEAIQVLDDNIARLSRNENTNRPILDYLQEVRGDLASGAKTLADIRDIRTNLRGNISQRNLMNTPAERIVGQVLDAARTDIQRDLTASAPGAVNAYQRADRFNAQRSDEIRQVVQRVIGRADDRLGGEQVMARIKAMAGPNGDSARLARMVDKLTPQEQADYAATVAASLGRRSADEEFSPALFVNGVRAISPAARRTIFGADGARSIENLRTLSEALRDTRGALNNSRSGVVANWGAFLRNVGSGGTLGALAGGVPGGIAGAAVGTGLSAVGAGVRNLSARALMSPDMSRWLAAAPRSATSQAIADHISRLTTVAARDPAISSEVLGLQKALRGMNDNMPINRAAAGQRDEEQSKAQ